MNLKELKYNETVEDVLFHFYKFFLKEKNILYRHVEEWFSFIKKNEKEKAFLFIKNYLSNEDLQFYNHYISLLDNSIEKSFDLMDFELDYMFEDVVKEEEYIHIGVPLEYKGQEWYHAIDYEHSMNITKEECIHNFIFNCLNKDKIICASNKNNIYGNIGFVFKGDEILYALDDLYSVVDYKTGERNIPYFSYKDNVIKEYIGDINHGQEMLIKPTNIISIFIRNNVTEKDFMDLCSPEVKMYLEKYNIPIIKL